MRTFRLRTVNCFAPLVMKRNMWRARAWLAPMTRRFGITLRGRIAWLSKGKDFARRRMMSQGRLAVVWLRIGNCSNLALRRWLVPLLPDLVERLEKGEILIEII